MLVDDTDVGEFGLYVRRITGGATYQDLLDVQPSPGEMFDRPDFIEDVPINHEVMAEVVTGLDGDLLENELVRAWDLEPGPHDIHTGRLNRPDALWICAPLQVVEG